MTIGYQRSSDRQPAGKYKLLAVVCIGNIVAFSLFRPSKFAIANTILGRLGRWAMGTRNDVNELGPALRWLCTTAISSQLFRPCRTITIMQDRDNHLLSNCLPPLSSENRKLYPQDCQVPSGAEQCRVGDMICT